MKSPIINFRHGALLIGFLLALTAASVLAQDSPAPPVVKTRFDASGPAEKRGERVGAEGNLVLLPSNYRSAATGSDSQMAANEELNRRLERSVQRLESAGEQPRAGFFTVANLLIVGVAALIGAVLGFLLGRRSKGGNRAHQGRPTESTGSDRTAGRGEEASAYEIARNKHKLALLLETLDETLGRLTAATEDAESLTHKSWITSVAPAAKAAVAESAAEASTSRPNEPQLLPLPVTPPPSAKPVTPEEARCAALYDSQEFDQLSGYHVRKHANRKEARAALEEAQAFVMHKDNGGEFCMIPATGAQGPLLFWLAPLPYTRIDRSEYTDASFEMLFDYEPAVDPGPFKTAAVRRFALLREVASNNYALVEKGLLVLKPAR